VKILIVAPVLPGVHGPGAMPMLLHAQLEALAARHQVTLVSGVGDEPWEEAAAAELLQSATEVHLADRRRPLEPRRRLRRRMRLAGRWVGGGTPWLTLWWATPSMQAVLDRLTASRSFDVVAVEDSSMALLRLPPGVPTVLTEHEADRAAPPGWGSPGRDPLPGWALQRLDWRRWSVYRIRAWRSHDLVQVFTEHDARVVAELAPELAPRVRVNPFGLVLPPAADPRRESPGCVMFVGNFTHPPNRDAAAWLVGEIMPRVRETVPTARLRLVGSAPPREVADLVGPGVELIADPPEVDPWLQTAAVCVAPVRLGGGMRMKVLCALASGKAVVATTRGADGYVRRGGELPLVLADDGDAFAAAVVELLVDERRRDRLRRRARAFAEQFHSPAAWGERLEAIYEEARRRSSSAAG
jgi:glycosyltransferase involved in cell wall biosynthesis